MKAVKIDLGADLEIIEIHVFADWHIGDSLCNLKAITNIVADVEQKRNAYVILNGDLLNNATTTSVSDTYSEKVPPMDQINMLVGLLTPIKDRILFADTGNHEFRTYKQDGIDMMALVMAQLGLIDRYGSEGGIIFLRFGHETDHGRKMRYSIYCTHGSGGGKKEGGKVNRLADLASIVDTDIYIHSHTHLPVVMKESFYRADSCNSSVKLVDKLFVNTSAQLKYGGYGQVQSMKPACNNNPVIYLDGAKRRMTAML